MRRLSTTPMPCRSNIRNRGSAKYLVSTLSRGSALSPLHSISSRQDLSETIPQTTTDVLPPRKHYHPLSVWLSSRNLLRQGRAHMPSGCTGSSATRKCLQSLCSWVAVHKCDTLADHRHGPWVTTQHNPNKSHFHPGVSFTSVVFLSEKHFRVFPYHHNMNSLPRVL